MNPEAARIVTELRLEPLPREGGFFRRTWESEARLPDGRTASSAIVFLLTPENFSAWHRLRSEELWHFHAGDAVELVQLDLASGTARVTSLGSEGATSQCVVPSGVWQAARIRPAAELRGWALVGCTVTPAWEEKEFELGQREVLLREFFREAEWIRALTR